MKASDNQFPSVLFQEGVAPANPVAGFRRVFFRASDHKLCAIDSTGAVVELGAQGPAGTNGTNGTNGANGVGVPSGGTSGQILAKNSNTDYDTHWIAAPAGGAGALVLLEQHTASSSASLDFTTAVSSAYDEYLIELVNIQLDTNGANLGLRMSTDGSTYLAGTNYHWSAAGAKQNAGQGLFGAGSTSMAVLFPSVAQQSLYPNFSISGSFRLCDPGSSIYKSVGGTVSGLHSSTDFYSLVAYGVCTTTSPVVKFQVVPSGGLIVVGTVRVYGVAKS